jgi:hypothetical protein
MKYKQVMKTQDKDNWTHAIFEELERMLKLQALKTELKKNMPKGAKMLT